MPWLHIGEYSTALSKIQSKPVAVKRNRRLSIRAGTSLDSTRKYSSSSRVWPDSNESGLGTPDSNFGGKFEFRKFEPKMVILSPKMTVFHQSYHCFNLSCHTEVSFPLLDRKETSCNFESTVYWFRKMTPELFLTVAFWVKLPVENWVINLKKVIEILS